jgi:hypothetical protein
MNCPSCNKPVPNDQVNIQADIGKCNNCGSVFRISETLSNVRDGFNMENPPGGIWVDRGFNELTIGASTRSPIAFFLVPFMLVWSGISLGGIYGTQLMSGEFDLTMSLFGIPFILGSVLFWALTLMTICGKVEFKLNQDGGSVFTGLGSKVGLRKSFRWDEINSIREGTTNLRYPGSQGHTIVLEGKKRIVTGSGLNDARRYYIFKSLEKVLTDKKMNRRIF